MDLLDFKKMRKVASDAKTSTFEHEKGHKVVIAHDALPKLLKAQIKMIPLSKGGSVDGEDQPETQPTPILGSGRKYYNDPTGPVMADAPVDSAPQTNPDPVLQGVPSLDLQQNPVGTPEQELLGERQKAAVEAQLAKQQEPLTKNYASAMGNTAAQQAAAPEAQAQEINNYRDYLNQHPITPKKPNVLNAMGFILGGMGSGVTGGPNQAVGMFNQMVDRDLNSQIANTSNRKNLVDAYDRLTGNRLLSIAAAKISLTDQYLAAMKDQALKLGTPTSMAMYNMLAGAKAGERAAQMGVFHGTAKAIQQMGGPDITHSNQQQGQPQQQGAPQGQQPQQGTEQPESSMVQPLLHPGSQQQFDALSFNPTAKADYENTRQQFTGAQQADKALANLGPAFDTMNKNTNRASQYAGILEKGLSAIPFVGGAAAGAVDEGRKTVETNRVYDMAKTAILSDITNALRGTNVSGEDIRRIVDDNSPVETDSPEVRDEKRKNIEGFIKRSTPTSLLQKYHLLGK